ncbi:unnamed protein product [Blepharisma stoltei]|uniref:Uncharacterized protein n=1 Tax=Blepharisma stoltei TaxID=1481888 RepID=A0AAU9IDY9_9CILI|nr:unnamed protein product [Blepharisma stoltei]
MTDRRINFEIVLSTFDCFLCRFFQLRDTFVSIPVYTTIPSIQFWDTIVVPFHIVFLNVRTSAFGNFFSLSFPENLENDLLGVETLKVPSNRLIDLQASLRSWVAIVAWAHLIGYLILKFRSPKIS